jgi:hypothetical protein
MYPEIGAIVIGVFGLLLLITGLHRLWRRRIIMGSLQGLSGTLLITAAVTFFALLGNFYTYNRLTAEQDLAQLHFSALAPQHYQATLRYPSGEQQKFTVFGDEWQLDARILKWKGYATLVGFDTVYRLDRFSGRYSDLTQEREYPRSVYDLTEEPRFDLWRLAREYNKRIPWVDALYGSAAYLPMADGADFQVSLTAGGLVVRPLNEPARKAVEAWR